jgi:5'-methylthioadenosine phosphorylase
MTTLQEAKLSREAEICYAAMAMVTDYDCWRDETEEVNVESVLAILNKNSSLAKQTIANLITKISEERNCICPNSLKGAIMTQPSAIDEGSKIKLAPLIGKYLKK